MVSLSTATYDEPKHLSDVVKCEFEGFSREKVTIGSGAGALEIGTVLGKVTADGKYKAHVNGAVDGTETAIAVLVSRVDATAADVEALIIESHAVVSRLGLEWDASVDDEAKKDAAIAQLAAVYIKTRQGA